MQAQRLPILAGWQWIRMGWILFRTQPAVLFTWTMMISLGLILAMLIAPIGPMIFITLVPTITFLTLTACRRIHNGERPVFSEWFKPLKEKALFGKLLRLGGLYMAISLLAALVAFLPFHTELSMALQSLDEAQDLTQFSQILNKPVMIFTVLYFILAALFWYAPVLVGWHGIAVTRSLFYSAVACWRNKWSLALYALIWFGIFNVVDVIFGAVANLISLQAAAVLQVPANLFVASVLYCSFYPTYITVFRSIRRDEDWRDEN